ncbi:MAG: iron-containing redox enzyme family protein [Sporichthyaceae bacterium]
MNPVATHPVPPVAASAGRTLPAPRGPLSTALIDALRSGAGLAPQPIRDAEPFSDDVQLSLYVAYELHYRGFLDAPVDREWDLDVLRLRLDLEDLFVRGLRAAVETAGADPAAEVRDHLETLRLPPSGPSVGASLLHSPDRARMREVLVHRSLYHLKEADPQAWALPRLEGAAKALVAAVEFDEYGGGSPDRMHSELFASLLRAFDLSSDYGAYLDSVPAPMLAVVNLMSTCGLRRALRGALIGQLAVVELTSPLGSQRMDEVVRRLDGDADAREFYAEHAVADAVHERVMREAIEDLLAREPDTAADVLFGIRAALLLEDRLDEHLLTSWEAGRSSLRPVLQPEREVD